MQAQHGGSAIADLGTVSLSPAGLRLAAIVAVAIGLHASLLLAFAPVSRSSSVSSTALPAMSVRLLAPPAEVVRHLPPVVADAPPSVPSARAVTPAPSRVDHGTEHNAAPSAATFGTVPPLPSRSPHAAAPQSDASPTTATQQTPLSAAVALPTIAPSQPPPLPPAPDYASAGQLDPGPQPLQEIEPAYPDAAGMRSGSVVLRLLIDATGVVDEVAVVRSSPKGLFDASALAAFGNARFLPGRMLGVAVKSQITVEVEFTPINRGSTVSGRSY